MDPMNGVTTNFNTTTLQKSEMSQRPKCFKKMTEVSQQTKQVCCAER